jgi:hypothetical protein
MAKSYAEKLKDPRWQKKRLEILEQRKWECEVCRNKDRTLDVHHGYYDWRLEPWEYPDGSYWVICEDCHKIITIALVRIHKAIAFVPAETVLRLGLPEVEPLYITEFLSQYIELFGTIIQAEATVVKQP